MKKISIIVPVYNAEKYIERCLTSIIKQKYENIEIIVINDGSTDNSEQIINKYIDKIKYIKKTNTGLSDTRNYGVELATGQYIMFVDSDDYIDEDLLEKISPYMEQDVDVIKFKARKVNEAGKEIGLYDGPVFGVMKGDEAFSKLCFSDQLLEIACVYIYKKELLLENNFKYTKGMYHEDFGLTPLIIIKSKTFISTNIYGYNYVQSTNSITRNEDYTKTVKKVYDLLAHYDNIVKQMKNYDISRTAKQDVKIFCTNAILLRVNDLKKQDRKEFIKQIRKRKMQKNIIIKNPKQVLKRIILEISIPMYLKMR